MSCLFSGTLTRNRVFRLAPLPDSDVPTLCRTFVFSKQLLFSQQCVRPTDFETKNDSIQKSGEKVKEKRKKKCPSEINRYKVDSLDFFGEKSKRYWRHFFYSANSDLN